VTYQSHAAQAPTSDAPLSRLLKTRSADKQFVERLLDVVFSKQSLIAAKLLLPYDAQKLINKVDKVWEISPPVHNLLISFSQALDLPAVAEIRRFRRRCFKYLYRISGHHRLLPSAYKLKPGPRRRGKPIGSGGFAEVWKGVYNGQQVAIKVLKVYETDNLQKIGKVSCRYLETNKRQRTHWSAFPSDSVGRC
jgi:hypothetical protein